MPAGETCIGSLAIYSEDAREATETDIEIATHLTQTASIIISRHEERQARQDAENALRDKQPASSR
jgi:GAF domain-containing protein